MKENLETIIQEVILKKFPEIESWEVTEHQLHVVSTISTSTIKKNTLKRKPRAMEYSVWYDVSEDMDLIRRRVLLFETENLFNMIPHDEDDTIKVYVRNSFRPSQKF